MKRVNFTVQYRVYSSAYAHEIGPMYEYHITL